MAWGTLGRPTAITAADKHHRVNRLSMRCCKAMHLDHHVSHPPGTIFPVICSPDFLPRRLLRRWFGFLALSNLSEVTGEATGITDRKREM